MTTNILVHKALSNFWCGKVVWSNSPSSVYPVFLLACDSFSFQDTRGGSSEAWERHLTLHRFRRPPMATRPEWCFPHHLATPAVIPKHHWKCTKKLPSQLQCQSYRNARKTHKARERERSKTKRAPKINGPRKKDDSPSIRPQTGGHPKAQLYPNTWKQTALAGKWKKSDASKGATWR